MNEPSIFTDLERRFLTSPPRALARVATIGEDGMPHVVPSRWSYNAELGTIDTTGRDAQKTKRFRDVSRTGKAAIVIDGIAPGDGFNPWAIEIGGRAEAVTAPDALIRIYPNAFVVGVSST